MNAPAVATAPVTILELYRERRAPKANGRRRYVWRWRLTDHQSGNIIGASSESYTNRNGAVANLHRATGIRLATPLRAGMARFVWLLLLGDRTLALAERTP